MQGKQKRGDLGEILVNSQEGIWKRTEKILGTYPKNFRRKSWEVCVNFRKVRGKSWYYRSFGNLRKFRELLQRIENNSKCK